MKNKGKKNVVVINKEVTAENWCFVCKDGGDLRICDYKQCLKSYHPSCVEKDDSFLESDENWACARHTCSYCHRSSYFYCYTCTNGVCRRCLPGANFFKVKGKYGFCCACLKLALLIEEDKNCDSDGETVDFTDRETYEGLFMEYYVIIKKEEGFEARDIYASKNQVKVKKKHQSGSGSEEFDELEEEISDDDLEQEKKRKKMRKENKSEQQKSSKQGAAKSNKEVFIGWASRPLVEFLTSIGKSTSEQLSQFEVASIVNQYVRENKLFHPKKKRIITCDAQLQSLFKRKTISRYKINDLLEAHFAENQDESEDDEQEYDSEENSADISSNASKRQRKLDVEKKVHGKDAKSNVLQSHFASIVAENIKLVYLKRSLLHELLKQPESFEEKVIGCFVRVKSDPHDYRSRASHQLMQVKGVKKASIGETSADITLLLSDMPTEIHMNLVSDDEFSEEECNDLRQKVLSGLLERPTVRNLEKKAKMLHEDIIKLRIKKELPLLQNLIDRANEKGWRSQMFEYLERKKKLQNPSEQLKMIENVPPVIPDVSDKSKPDSDSDSGDITGDNRNAEGSPKSITLHNSADPSNGSQDNQTSEGKACNEDPATQVKTRGEDCAVTRSKRKQNKLELKQQEQTEKGQKAPKASVIELSSDGENHSGGDKAGDVVANEKGDGQESEVWCVRGPNGEQDKCSVSVLKHWVAAASYAAEFKAWREGEDEKDAVWLKEAISKAFPNK